MNVSTMSKRCTVTGCSEIASKTGYCGPHEDGTTNEMSLRDIMAEMSDRGLIEKRDGEIRFKCT